MSKKHKAFTLVELVIIITILGILAFIAAPRFSRTTDYTLVFFFTELLQDLREMQSIAMLTECDVSFSFGADGIGPTYTRSQRATLAGTCDPSTAASFSNPVTLGQVGGAGIIRPPASITQLSGSFASYYFDKNGKIYNGGTNILLGTDIINVGNATTTRTITLVGETGHVYDSTP